MSTEVQELEVFSKEGDFAEKFEHLNMSEYILWATCKDRELVKKQEKWATFKQWVVKGYSDTFPASTLVVSVVAKVFPASKNASIFLNIGNDRVDRGVAISGDVFNVVRHLTIEIEEAFEATKEALADHWKRFEGPLWKDHMDQESKEKISKLMEGAKKTPASEFGAAKRFKK